MKSFGIGSRLISEEIEGIKKLLNLVSVDIHTGLCVWSVDRNNRTRAGSPAGTLTSKGYTRLQMGGKGYMLHRIVFYMAKGYLPQIVDHKEGIEKGNGIDNLQEATNVENIRKKKKPSHNRSGYKGVLWVKGCGRWRAQISANGKKISLGYFDSAESANAAYQKKAKELFGDFYRESS